MEILLNLSFYAYFNFVLPVNMFDTWFLFPVDFESTNSSLE